MAVSDRRLQHCRSGPWFVPEEFLSTGRGQLANSAAPEIAQHLPRAVVPGQAGDTAAGVRARSAVIQALDRPAIVAVAEHRAREKQLVQPQCAVENVAAREP